MAKITNINMEDSEVNEYELVIVAKSQDIDKFSNNISLYQKFLKPSGIVIICPQDDIDVLSRKNLPVKFIEENSIFAGLTFSAVKKYLQDVTGDDHRCGWYFQQFLKMAYATICPNETYLIWDADTIPLHKINFRNKEGKLLFTMTKRYAKSYFNTLKNLLGYDKIVKESFVAEHMLFKKNLMIELIQKIEITNPGMQFFEIIINSILPIDYKKGMGYSEFETYGTYVMHNYPLVYCYRHIHSLRIARGILGTNPNNDMLTWAANSFELISLEEWDKPIPILSKLAMNPTFRKIFTFNICSKFAYFVLCYRYLIHKFKQMVI